MITEATQIDKDLLVKEYAEKGFVLWPERIPSQQTASLLKAWEQMWILADASTQNDTVLYRDHEVEGRVADRLEHVRLQSKAYADLCEASEIKSFAEELLGGTCFVLKDKLITKAPQTSGYDPHQDFAYWSNIGLEPDEVLSVAICLDDVTDQHGPLELYEGLHGSTLPAPKEEALDVDPSALEGKKRFAFISKPGGIVFFHALTPHFSASNTATTPRRLFIITYALKKGPEEEIRAAYKAGFDRIQKFHLKDG
ncbi:MAG: phytanoyl-CoA dioxygenase family protein [Henriciella sp.]|nr:phytanoyl-CoA dioxygenase family protein [Henriciella sp.]